MRGTVLRTPNGENRRDESGIFVIFKSDSAFWCTFSTIIKDLRIKHLVTYITLQITPCCPTFTHYLRLTLRQYNDNYHCQRFTSIPAVARLRSRSASWLRPNPDKTVILIGLRHPGLPGRCLDQVDIPVLQASTTIFNCRWNGPTGDL